MNEPNDIERRISHRIPGDLEAMKEMLPAALRYLTYGEMPKAVPIGAKKTVNFRINSTTEARITRLAPEFGSRTLVIIHALAWAFECSACQQLMLTNTKL